MPLVYWSACGEAFPPAGATEETGQRKQMTKGHDRTWEEERVEIQMSLELGFTAMRVFMEYLRGYFSWICWRFY